MEPINALRGMHDILPPASLLWQFVEDKARQVFSRFGFSEIRTPIVEASELFQRSIGEVTDIVEKEMYTFVDRKEKSLSLRPEGTASVVRAVMEAGLLGKGGTEGTVLKLYYMGPMFRYERPQKGRQRQFYQIGAEVFGDDSAKMDAEILALSALFLKEIGIDSMVTLELNSLGSSQCRPKYIAVLKDYFGQKLSRLCPDCQRRFERNPLRILDCKVAGCQEVIAAAPTMMQHLDEKSRDHFNAVLKNLDLLSLKYCINERIVRGLDYYTGTTFEFTTKELGSQGAVLAGGRYDGLCATLGGPLTPAIGFAAGMERLVMLLEKTGWRQPQNASRQVYVAGLGEGPTDLAFQLMHMLRGQGICAHMDLRGKSLKAHLKQADRLGVTFVLILGEEEMQKKAAIVKAMKTGEQETLGFTSLPDLVEKIKRYP